MCVFYHVYFVNIWLTPNVLFNTRCACVLPYICMYHCQWLAGVGAIEPLGVALLQHASSLAIACCGCEVMVVALSLPWLSLRTFLPLKFNWSILSVDWPFFLLTRAHSNIWLCYTTIWHAPTLPLTIWLTHTGIHPFRWWLHWQQAVMHIVVDWERQVYVRG